MCVVSAEGEILVHRKIPARPERLLKGGALTPEALRRAGVYWTGQAHRTNAVEKISPGDHWNSLSSISLHAAGNA